ncbi:hypothetical protein ACFWF7_44020 [Nocardia sp. NPDC060256]|uniref:hypothetical protein n=1 Tax=unclassified Nocardia TaxID=2637762 RepID=UPI003654DC2A
MEALTVVGVIAALLFVGWLVATVTNKVEETATDLTDKAIFGRARRTASDLGTSALRIRTSVPSDKLWEELAYRLPLPSSKPRSVQSLYVAGEFPSSTPGNHGMRVDWNDCIRSGIFVVGEEDSRTVCEHAMLQWADNGQVMRNAVTHFETLRENLVAIVRSMDPASRAVLVDENDRETPFTSARQAS